MSNSFTLDDIRAAADAKYASTDITIGDTTCVLVNPLRLTKEKRKALTETQTRLDDGDEAAEADEDAQMESLRDALRIVCETEHQANVLIGAVGDDLALLAVTFEKYSAGTQAGEASASAA